MNTIFCIDGNSVRRAWARGVLGLCAALSLIANAGAAEASVDDLVRQAREAFRQGKGDEAVALATQAIAAEPKNPGPRHIRAQIHAARRQHEKAVTDFTEALKLDPSAVGIYQARGAENFRLGRMAESIADFDKFIAANPGQEAHHWQRGIAYYYAGRFTDGRKAFELHQTVNSHDVENAVWHFLCAARELGIEKARAALIPIDGDSRVPMAQVHALFAGKLKPEDVMTAATAGGVRGELKERQVFYANLYLGLYFEALGDAKRARDYIEKSAADYQKHDYMGDVAHVHAEILRKQKATP